MYDREQLLVLFQQSGPAMSAMQAAENKLVEADRLREKHSRFGTLNILKIIGVCIFLWLTDTFLDEVLGVDEMFAFLIPLAFCIVVFLVSRAKMKKQEKVMTEIAAEIEKIKADPSLSWLPYNYRGSAEFGLIVGYINNMRAHNLTDAINLLETEMHRARVELNAAAAAASAEEAAANTRWR